MRPRSRQIPHRQIGSAAMNAPDKPRWHHRFASFTNTIEKPREITARRSLDLDDRPAPQEWDVCAYETIKSDLFKNHINKFGIRIFPK